ncbi:dienelactone hydrolase family protein [Mycolicibacterium vanbaalenii]|uniref:dienelactone hydrolase family protein n=1 Tax=Mycolicibacterium vanbaalenii TaxID=110539 RepID=UPI0021F394D3|nr:alpha/beta fold hydrolase [Mycolicibacterium vanbaalenii]
MTVQHTSLRHIIDGAQFDAVLVRDDAAGAPPTVLVVHGMEGRSDAQLQFANRLAERGYQAIAVDLFGEDVSRGGMEATSAAMTGFLDDREALARRLATVFGTLTGAAEVDADRVAAIGFCFGGLCVLDLARAGHPLVGVASFHGLLTPPPQPQQREVTAKVIVFHGWDDPFALRRTSSPWGGSSPAAASTGSCTPTATPCTRSWRRSPTIRPEVSFSANPPHAGLGRRPSSSSPSVSAPRSQHTDPGGSRRALRRVPCRGEESPV